MSENPRASRPEPGLQTSFGIPRGPRSTSGWLLGEVVHTNLSVALAQTQRAAWGHFSKFTKHSMFTSLALNHIRSSHNSSLGGLLGYVSLPFCTFRPPVFSYNSRQPPVHRQSLCTLGRESCRRWIRSTAPARQIENIYKAPAPPPPQHQHQHVAPAPVSHSRRSSRAVTPHPFNTAFAPLVSPHGTGKDPVDVVQNSSSLARMIVSETRAVPQ